MEKVKEIEVFNFTKENAKPVKLHLGQAYTTKHDQYNNEEIKEWVPAPVGLRWMITSAQNPLPIRNGTWFQGFNSGTMIKWFTNCGYVLQSIVNCKGDILFHAAREEPAKTEIQIRRIEKGFYRLAKHDMVAACLMYSSLYNCGLAETRDILRDIICRFDEEGNDERL